MAGLYGPTLQPDDVSLPTVHAWYSSRDAACFGGSFPSDGATIPTLFDKSGNGFNLVQASGSSQPFYRATGAGDGGSYLDFGTSATNNTRNWATAAGFFTSITNDDFSWLLCGRWLTDAGTTPFVFRDNLNTFRYAGARYYSVDDQTKDSTYYKSRTGQDWIVISGSFSTAFHPFQFQIMDIQAKGGASGNNFRISNPTGTQLLVGGNFVANYYISDMIFWRGAMSQRNLLRVHRGVMESRAIPAATGKAYVAIGNSTTEYGTWPRQLVEASDTPEMEFFNMGHGGGFGSEIIGDISNYEGIAADYLEAGRTCIFTIFTGHNDAGILTSSETIFGGLFDNIRAAGHQTIAMTISAKGSGTQNEVTYDAFRAVVNDNAAKHDATFDFKDYDIGQPFDRPLTGADVPQYYIDAVHFTDTGRSRIAELLTSTFNALLPYWQNLSGETSSTRTTSSVQASDIGRRFRCVATNVVGSAISNEVTIVEMQAETLAYQTRVSSGGGTMTTNGLTFVDSIFTHAAANSLTLSRGYVFGDAVNIPANTYRSILELTGNGEPFTADAEGANSVIFAGTGGMMTHEGRVKQTGRIKLASEQLMDNTDWTIMLYVQKPLKDTSSADETTLAMSQYNTGSAGRISITFGQTGDATLIPITGTQVSVRSTTHGGNTLIEPLPIFFTYNATTRAMTLYDPTYQEEKTTTAPAAFTAGLPTHLSVAQILSDNAGRPNTIAYMGLLKYSGILSTTQMDSVWENFRENHSLVADYALIYGNSVTSGSDAAEATGNTGLNWPQVFANEALQNNVLTIRPYGMGGKQLYYMRDDDFTKPTGSSYSGAYPVKTTTPSHTVDGVEYWGPRWKPTILVLDENQNTAANQSVNVTYAIDWAGTEGDPGIARHVISKLRSYGTSSMVVVGGTMMAVGPDGKSYATIISEETSVPTEWRKNLRDWSASIRTDSEGLYDAVYDLYTDFNLGWDTVDDGDPFDPTNDYPNGDPSLFYDDHQHPGTSGHALMAVGYMAAVNTVRLRKLVPAFTTHPSNTSKTAGLTATFTVVATQSPTSHQWQLDSGSGFADISGATSDSYTTPTLVEGDDANQYRCIATNATGSTTSNAATLTMLTIDADASDYFTRAEALGGSFDQSGINATYTESYIKSAINDFIVGCKTDSIWTKLTECYLLSHVTFGGLMAKLKYDSVATLTNTNFVAGDYLAVGSGAGLKGNGSTKYLATGFDTGDFASLDDISLGLYATEDNTLASKYLMGGGSDFFAIRDIAGAVYFYLPATDEISGSTEPIVGMYTGSRRSTSDIEAYKNGVSIGTDTSSTSKSGTGPIGIFCYAVSTSPTDARLAFAHIGTGLTTTDADNLASRVNALMTAIGANVY